MLGQLSDRFCLDGVRMDLLYSARKIDSDLVSSRKMQHVQHDLVIGMLMFPRTLFSEIRERRIRIIT